MEEAIRDSVLAGQRALDRFDYEESAAQFERALAMLAELPESRDTLAQRVDIQLTLRLALLPLERMDQILVHLGQAEQMAETLGDQHRLASIASYRANAYYLLGDLSNAIEMGHHALSIARNLDDISLEIVAHNQVGTAYWCRGNYRLAIDAYRWNMAHIQGTLIHRRLGSAGYPAVIARAGLAICLAEVGEFGEAIDFGESAVRLAEDLGHTPTLAHAHLFLGGVLIRHGDLHAAISALESSLHLCRTQDLRLLLPGTLTWLGYAYALAGQPREGIPFVEEAVEHVTATSRTGAQSHRDACLGEVYLLAGRVHDAATLAQRALRLAVGHGEQGFEAWTRRLMGEIASHEDSELGDAKQHYEEAAMLAEKLDMRPLQAHCYLGLGRVHHRAGRLGVARAELTKAVKMLEEMRMVFWLPETEEELLLSS